LADHYESLSIAALDKFKRAHGIAVAFADQDLSSFASAWIGSSEWLRGDYESAVKHAIGAIEKAPPTGFVALSRAHSILANILYAIGEYREAAREYALARRFAVEAHDLSMQSAVLYNVAAFHIARLSLEDAFGSPVTDDVALAELELNSVENLDTGIGVGSLGEMVPLLRAQLLLVKKQWEDASEHYLRALPTSAAYGSSRWESRFLAEQSHCLAMLGEHANAAELAERAIAQLHVHIEVDDLAACHARLSLALATLDRHDHAETHMTSAKLCLDQFRERQATRRKTLAPLILTRSTRP
jgi:tetratricopeptide (TPR) repeat protein